MVCSRESQDLRDRKKRCRFATQRDTRQRRFFLGGDDKVRIGKLPEAEKFAVEFRDRIRNLGFHELAVAVEHGQRAGLLAGIHKDPFDQMLAAQALTENLAIVSNEKLFDGYCIRRVW